MMGDGHGLSQSGGVLGQIVGRGGDARTHRHGTILSQAAVALKTYRGVANAKVRPSGAARRAYLAGDAGTTYNQVALPQLCDERAFRHYATTYLVPRDHRTEVACHRMASLDRVLDRAGGVLAGVRATDAGGVDLEDDFVPGWSWVRALLYADVRPAMENGRLQY
jgi:hypothetical protein